jgi:hypothetical protein
MTEAAVPLLEWKTHLFDLHCAVQFPEHGPPLFQLGM